MRLSFCVFFLIVMFSGNALGDHVAKGFIGPLLFGCETAENMIRLVRAKDDTEGDAILAGASCYVFENTPAVLVKFIHRYRDREVYEVETVSGERFFTFTTLPGRGA